MTERLLDKFLETDSNKQAELLAMLTPEERHALLVILDSELENPWARWQNYPIGFVEQGLGETLWSKQKEILTSLTLNKRTVVPACHAPGKSHLAARAVAWWLSCHAPGTAVAITTATTHRQVRNIMWAQIRRVHSKNNLPGEADTVQWKINGTVVGYGFSPAAHDETAIQGIHAPNLLVVVDEAGGLSDTIGGALESLMTGGNTKLLVLGNPPTDTEQTWFERICSSPLYNVISISAYDTPNFTGEATGRCKACPEYIEAHEVRTHLVDETWVADVMSEFGEDSPFVEARVMAQFPKSSTGKVIPFAWAELATENETPIESKIIKLGVDIASDGGDEFVIARLDGGAVSIVHRSSGKQNANAVDVAGVVMREIEKSIELHTARGITERIRVKVDTIGLGWGVVSMLDRWCKERALGADIIAVNVSEKPKDQAKFKNQRAEMWWNARQMVQPKDGKQDIRLNVDRFVLSQMAGPTYSSDASGRVVIESKIDMKKRGVASPDRAEAVLLALYENRSVIQSIAPISFTQSNEWGTL